LAAGTPASKLCSPREVRARDDPSLGQGEVAGSVLSWAFSPLELAPARLGTRFIVQTHGRTGRTRTPCASRSRSLASFARFRPRPQAHAPGIRRHARSIEPRTPPPGSDPCGERVCRRAHRRSPTPPASRRSVLPAPPLGGAPRLPRPRPQAPAKGDCGWTPETLFRVLPVGPPLSRRAGSCGVFPLIDPARRSRFAAAAGLYALRALRPYERFTSGETPRRRNALRLLRAVRCPSEPDLRPARPSRSVSFRWSSFGTAPRSTAVAVRRRRFCGSLRHHPRD